VQNVLTVAELSRLVSQLKKGVEFVWHEPQKLAFKHLVDALSSLSTLVHFDETAELFLKTDASYAGLGAVLTQKKGGEEKVVSFLSRRLLADESNWASNDLECFAVVWAIKKLRPYLYGRQFTIYSDNVTAVSLLRKKDLTGKFARWVMDLAEYDFQILHCTDPSNVVSDALSRQPPTRIAFGCPHVHVGGVCELCFTGVFFGEGVDELIRDRETDNITLHCPSFHQECQVDKCNFGGDFQPRVGILAPPTPNIPASHPLQLISKNCLWRYTLTALSRKRSKEYRGNPQDPKRCSG
jgi:hypothetical protein